MYQNPVQNRVAINILAFTEKADINDIMKPLIRANCSEFFRPHVSVRKPHMCELATIPKKPIDNRIPCWPDVISNSHFADGTTKPILINSVTRANKLPPVTNNSI